jgi:hypothetical protein
MGVANNYICIDKQDLMLDVTKESFDKYKYNTKINVLWYVGKMKKVRL